MRSEVNKQPLDNQLQEAFDNVLTLAYMYNEGAPWHLFYRQLTKTANKLSEIRNTDFPDFLYQNFKCKMEWIGRNPHLTHNTLESLKNSNNSFLAQSMYQRCKTLDKLDKKFHLLDPYHILK